MKNLLFGALFIVCYIFSNVAVGYASASNIEKALDSVVRIDVGDDAGRGHGTAFFIDNNILLTAFHCVFLHAQCNDHGPFVVKNHPVMSAEDLKILTNDNNGRAYLSDLALMQTVNSRSKWLELADSFATSGKEVAVLGVAEVGEVPIRFPITGHIITTWHKTISIKLGKETYHVNLIYFMLDIIIIAGMSGSPVVDNETGQAVGVVQEVLIPMAPPFKNIGYALGVLITKDFVQSLRK